MLRRSVLCLLGVLAFAAGARPADKPSSLRVYIGTYTQKGSKGIYLARFDPTTGTISTPELAAESKDPSFLAFHPTNPHLYAVNESTGRVSAFSISPENGTLKPLNQQETGGNGPCHLALDATGRMLIAANYGAGSFATFPVEPDGRLGARKSLIQFHGKGPDASRQEGPHAHSVNFLPGNQFVLIDDLGNDRTMIYRVHPETASVEPADPPYAQADPGAGPRHLTIDPKHRFVYVVNEMHSSVTRFALDDGKLKKIDTVSALPADFHGSNTAAEIGLDRTGKTLYSSNRGHDSIAVFHVNEAGALKLIQNAPSGGKSPRSFTLDPTGHWLLAAHQDSGNITVFRVDQATGTLTQVSDKTIDLPSPVCLLFAPR